MDTSRQQATPAAHRRYTVREAADVSGLAEKTIWRRIQRGELPATRERDGRRFRVWIAPEDVPVPAARGADGAGDTIGELRAEVAEMRDRLETLEAQIRAAGVAGMGRAISKAEAARLLERHGIPFHTARQWRGMPLAAGRDGDEGAAILTWAAAYLARIGGRAGAGELHRCDRAGCACQGMPFA